MNLSYSGEGTMQTDESVHRIVITGKGVESRGSGTAGGTVTATLTAVDHATTAVAVMVDLDLTGKPAQFGRGILSEVVARMAGLFVKQLEQIIAAGGPPPTAGVEGATPAGALSTGATTANAADLQPLDLLAIGPMGMITKYAPVVAGVIGGALLMLIASRRRKPLAQGSSGLTIVLSDAAAAELFDKLLN